MSSFGLPLIALFLSTPSARRATLEVRAVRRVGADFYPRPPRGGRQVCRAEAPAGQIISIHALREEGDTSAAENLAVAGVFLSTPSARRATRVRNQPHRRKDNFYPRPPRGGRHCRDCQRNHTWRFLSTPSARRATAALRLLHPRRPISIHALREEGDYLLDLLSRMTNEFLSTPSARRATLTEASGSSRPRNFYPRPPRGGRPGRVRAFQQHPRISIHALREEGDSPAPGMSCTQHNFYPRPPRGGRHELYTAGRLFNGISIHALREEGDPGCHDHCERYAEFLSTPSARRATAVMQCHPSPLEFLSTPSARRATTAMLGHME